MLLKKKYKELKAENESLMLTLNQLQAKVNYLTSKCHDKRVQVSILKNEIKLLEENGNLQKINMKASISKTCEALQSRLDSFIGYQKDEATSARAEGFKDGLSWSIDSIKSIVKNIGIITKGTK